MYGIDSNRLANKKSILSNTDDRNYNKKFDQCEAETHNICNVKSKRKKRAQKKETTKLKKGKKHENTLKTMQHNRCYTTVSGFGSASYFYSFCSIILLFPD